MIRKYSKKDKSKIINLLQLNTPQFFAPSEQNDLENYLENEIEDYFVMENGGKIIGAGGINYFFDEKIARIAWDIFHPNFQKKGLGTKLTQFRINHIHQKTNIEKIIVRTSQVSYLFYKKMGFQLQKTKKDFWAEGFDLYQMVLKK